MPAVLPNKLIQELDAVWRSLGDFAPTQLRRHVGALNAAQVWCRRALAEHHLVNVASALTSHFRADLPDLDAVGIPIDILQEFPGWRSGARTGFKPKPSGLRPPPAGAAEALGTLRLQLSPSSGSIPYSLALLRSLIRRADPSVRFVVIVEPGADLPALERLMTEFLNRRARPAVRFVELRCITVFAQDNARAAIDATGQAALAVPRAFMRGSLREDDELIPEDAQRAFGIPVVRTRSVWEGGNIVHDTGHCLVGADTVAENMGRFGLTAGEAEGLLAADLGAHLTILGDLSRARFDPDRGVITQSGQASFHIDLDVSLLGRFGRNRHPRALVADAARGLELLPAVLGKSSLFAARFLPPRRAKELIRAEYEAYARRRHPQLLQYAATLERLGYHVFGMPDLRIDPNENLFASVNLDFGYCNVLPGLCRGKAAVHYLPWGIEDMDRTAAARFRAAGVEPVCIATAPVANALMLLRGGLHCFSGTLM